MSRTCLAGFAALVSVCSPANGQAIDKPMPHLTADYYDADVYVPPTLLAGKQSAAVTANIRTVFTGFSEEARQAFEFAAAIWETHVNSPVPIDVQANFEPLAQNTLASTRPNLVAFKQSDTIRGPLAPNTWHATALAEAVIERNVNSSGPDFSVTFNSSFGNFYFGTDGKTPRGMVDFTTVALHEIGHGLGFTSSFRTETGDGDCTGTQGAGCWGLAAADFPSPGIPFAFDGFLDDRNGVALLNSSVYPNPSQALGNALASSALFFDGASVRSVNQNAPAKLYAPAPFEPGASIFHLDEQSFPPGDHNSLMTPNLAQAEAIMSPGPITCGLFLDMGWPLGDGCAALMPASLLVLEAALIGNNSSSMPGSTTASDVTINEFLA